MADDPERPFDDQVHGAIGAFAELTPAARAIWAKSGEPQGHGLLAHMLDVAAVAEALLRREPPSSLNWAHQAFDKAGDGLSRWLGFLVGLHDLGKASPGFQAKWPAGRAIDEAAGLTFPAAQLPHDRHDLVSAVELHRLLRPWLASTRRAKRLAQATAAHHGFVFDSTALDSAGARRVGEPTVWARARSEIFAGYANALAAPICHAQGVPDLPALSWLAGLTSVADWIGSNTEWFAPGERAETMAGHHQMAMALAERALDAIGWPRSKPLLLESLNVDSILSRTVGRPGLRARPLQAAADRLMSDIDQPALLIVEAPMGEGKTELAMLAHLRLQSTLEHRGLYIGLPTQATGNAMFERTTTFLRAFSQDSPLDIQLAHGGAMFNEQLVTLRNVWGEAGDAVRSSTWFSQRRRPLLSPYGVGTIDQLLLAALNVKHHFVRLWGLANRVVVLDEVHAYDTYTGTLIEGLLRWLKALRCSVVLMSATLPRAKRDALIHAWTGRASAVPELPYPRVLVTTDNAVRGEHFASRPQATVELQAIDESLESLAAQAIALVGAGGCGVVIVNTVDRAQQLFALLLRRLPAELPLILFHARFPADERLARERAVLAAFGSTGARPSAALLVATQVVEQSLDIDFDFMLSDLAPVDLLLQRAGRLHRHDRPRPPAHAVPRLTVAGLLATELPDLKSTAWGAIYDPFILYRTWALASRETHWRLPEDIDRVVQAVYGGDDLPAGLDPRFTKQIDVNALGEHLAAVHRQRTLAASAVIDARRDFQVAYLGKPRGNDEGEFPGIRNVTRMGPDSVTVVPVHAGVDGWRLQEEGAPFDPTAPLDDTIARQAVARQLRLARHDVVKAMREAAPTPAFEQHAWLRHVLPLVLTSGECTLGNTRIRLDRALGIVYNPTQPSAPRGTEENPI